ncbi:MAG: SUMF1/EgtB/PvdO family nonheme iron enzyme [Polyangiaceae bacterium]
MGSPESSREPDRESAPVSDAAASARPIHSAEELLPALSAPPEQVLRRASLGRRLVRVAIFAVVGGALGLGGYFGFKAFRHAQARRVPAKHFAADRATIGNAMWLEESPEFEVELGSYSLDVFEVTAAHYKTCVLDGACTRPARGAFCNFDEEDRDTHPINCVSFDQAAAYCRWVGKRLPTEFEWEHAARAAADRPHEGPTELYPWGVGPPDPRRANACGRECSEFFTKRGATQAALYDSDDGFPTTAPVGRFGDGATPDGLEDMAGNVWEWTASPFCHYPNTTCANDVEFVIRGGGFQSYQASTLEATSREGLARSEATITVGFRCAKDG